MWWIIPLIVIIMMTAAAMLLKPISVYESMPEQHNPMEGKKVVFVCSEADDENADGVRGHLEAVGESRISCGVYSRYVKRLIDVVLSFLGLVILSPLFLVLSLWIVIDDPGPVFFSQKRVGANKQFYRLHKFRSMKMSTPHNVPTHMLRNPNQYITRAGRFLRSHSLDELPQIWDIFIGNMSVVGPRPALWNQELLVAERDRWEANNIKPGLTGWAQINGRDELDIAEKARLDGEYAEILLGGGFKAFRFDVKCIFGTFFSVVRRDGVVEGGTGSLDKEKCHTQRCSEKE